MTLNKNKLGRGLAALIPDKSRSFLPPKSGGIQCELLPINMVESNDSQPRRIFEPESLEELADSIRSNGILQPILVSKSDTIPFVYKIIAGERRWRASKLAGLTEIPAIIKTVSEQKALEASIIENIQRENLNPIEEGEAYANLKEKFIYTDEEIAKIVGKSRTHIANLRRLLSLSEEIKELIREKKLSVGHAKLLVNAKHPEVIAHKILENYLNVRQTEQLIKAEERAKPIKTKEKDKNLTTLEEKLSEKLGLRVKIKDNKPIGCLTIEFKTLEELNAILQKLS